jgi:hypothetical protein
MSSLAITLNADGVQVMPGQAASFTVEVRNLGTVVDRYHCEIVGMDPSWVTVTPASLELFPARELDERGRSDSPPTVGRFSVALHPPRSSAAIAGAWPIGAKVVSEHDPANRLVEEATITILPFGSLDADLRPALMGGRFGASTALHLANKGNRPEAVTITGTDRAERLDFRIDRPLLTLQPGETVNVKLRLSGGDVKLVGGSDTRPFTLDVRANSYDTAPVALSGTYERKALIPSGLPIAVATLAALVMGGLAVMSILRPAAGPPGDTAGLPLPSAAVSAPVLPTAPPVEPSVAAVPTPAPPTATPPPTPTPPPTASPIPGCPPSLVDATYTTLGGATSFLLAAGPGCDIALPDGGSFRDFAGGSIYVSPGATTGAALQSNLRDYWRGLGATTSALGYPTSNSAPHSNGDGGWQANFQHGRASWSPATGGTSCINLACITIIPLPTLKLFLQTIPPPIFMP